MSSAQITIAVTFFKGWLKTQHIFTWSQNITLQFQLAASSIWLTSYLSFDKWSIQHGESQSVNGMKSIIHKINKDINWNIHTIWTLPNMVIQYLIFECTFVVPSSSVGFWLFCLSSYYNFVSNIGCWIDVIDRSDGICRMMASLFGVCSNWTHLDCGSTDAEPSNFLNKFVDIFLDQYKTLLVLESSHLYALRAVNDAPVPSFIQPKT